jgi:hypothetical protein
MTTQTPQKTVIPAAWRKTVCAILAERNSNSIRITATAWNRWEVEFPETLKGDLYTIFEETLSKEVVEGERVFGMKPEGEVYKFFFEYEKRKMYGKINLLLPQRQVILILSAHISEIASGDKL